MEIKRRVATPGANPWVLRGAFLLYYFLGNIEGKFEGDSKLAPVPISCHNRGKKRDAEEA
jgi:hypothetical protein